MSAESMGREAGNLRLPVPFFDLLMVLLVCFLVFVSPVRPDGFATQSVDIPVARGGTGAAGENLLPVIPHQVANSWSFELAEDGRRLSAAALARHARETGRKVVVVARAATALQDFIDMQTALTKENISFGLAVKNEETKP